MSNLKVNKCPKCYGVFPNYMALLRHKCLAKAPVIVQSPPKDAVEPNVVSPPVSTIVQDPPKDVVEPNVISPPVSVSTESVPPDKSVVEILGGLLDGKFPRKRHTNKSK